MVEKFFKMGELLVTIRRKYMGFVHLIEGFYPSLGWVGTRSLKRLG